MKLSVILALILAVVLHCGECLALEWKYLHGRADVTSLEQARRDVDRVPADLGKLYVLALVYFNEHRDKDADDFFARMLEIQPDSVAGQWGHAEYLRRIHETEQSRKILEALIAAHPDFYPAYISLAHIKYFAMDFDKVIQLMSAVIKQDTTGSDISTLVRAHCIYAGAKGMIAYNGGPVSKMINGMSILNHLRIAQKLQPDNVVVPYGFGSYYLLAPVRFGKNINTAEHYFNKALALDPLVADIYVRLAEIWMIRGDQEKAHEYLRKATELDPKCGLVADVESGRCDFVCGWTNR